MLRYTEKGKAIMVIIFSVIMGSILFIYAIAWAMSFRTYDAAWGVSFHKEYARSLGLDWRETYTAMLEELKPSHVRISALWSEIEETRGVYQFDSLDWMMLEAAKRNVRVTLVVGQKAPRWPECHIPTWVNGKLEEHKPAFLAFVNQVVKRYQLHPALDTWQVENEPFITFDFGECKGYNPQIIYEETDMVRAEDPNHPVMVTDSGELNLWLRSSRIGDVFGTTIYRMVRMPTGHRFTYGWLPPGLYKLRAVLLGIPYEKFYVAELQGEPWFHQGDATNNPIEEQEKTMNPSILKKNIGYAERVGASRIYLWGAEWWYFMKVMRGDGRYWEMAKYIFSQ